MHAVGANPPDWYLRDELLTVWRRLAVTAFVSRMDQRRCHRDVNSPGSTASGGGDQDILSGRGAKAVGSVGEVAVGEG